MKKSFLIASIFVGLFVIVLTQTGKSGTQNPVTTNSRMSQTDQSTIIESRVSELTELLSLSADQASKVKAIYEKTMGSQASGSGMQSMAEQRHNEIRALLTDAQKTKYEANLKEREQRMQRATGSDAGRGQMNSATIIESRVKELTETLSLTADQVSKVKAIYEKTLGVQQSGSTNSEQRTALSTQRHDEIKALLNADQQKKYEEYLNNRSR